MTLRREQHIRQLVDYARRGKAKTFILAVGSFILTGTLLRTVELSAPIVFSIGFLGIIPLLVREWKLGTIRRSFNDDAMYQRLIRLPFWMTLFGLCLLYVILGWVEFGTPARSVFLTIAALCLGMFLFQRTFDRVILKLEPDYITDRELHREVK